MVLLKSFIFFAHYCLYNTCDHLWIYVVMLGLVRPRHSQLSYVQTHYAIGSPNEL